MKLVELVGIHVEATSGAPVLLLREHEEPHRVVPIFVGPNEAAAIAMALSGALPPRPLTPGKSAGAPAAGPGRGGDQPVA